MGNVRIIWPVGLVILAMANSFYGYVLLSCMVPVSDLPLDPGARVYEVKQVEEVARKKCWNGTLGPPVPSPSFAAAWLHLKFLNIFSGSAANHVCIRSV